jgi:hypothetical protein
VAEVIAGWVEEGSRYLASRELAEPDARAVMYALLAALEGGFVLARAQREVEPLLAAGPRPLRLRRHPAGRRPSLSSNRPASSPGGTRLSPRLRPQAITEACAATRARGLRSNDKEQPLRPRPRRHRRSGVAELGVQ